MKKYNNKILITVLIILVTAFVLSRIFRAPKRESNLPSQLVEVDASEVTEMRVSRPDKEEIRLIHSKQGSAWDVTMGDRKAPADTVGIQDALRMASDIKVKGLVSRKKKKWDAFNISDSSAIRVSLYAKDEKIADFMIGKVGFAENQQNGMYTHVRLADENEVYSTESFLNPYFNKDFKDWRNQALLRLDQKEITKVAFNYPDSSFVLEKRDSLWYVDDQLADSTNTATYLNTLKSKDVPDFDDAFSPQELALPQVIQIESNGNVLAVLKAWPKQEGAWTIASSLQEGVYFSDPKGGTVNALFVGQSTFSNQ